MVNNSARSGAAAGSPQQVWSDQTWHPNLACSAFTLASSSSCRHHHSNSHLRCRSLGPLDWANARSGRCSLAQLGVPPRDKQWECQFPGAPMPRATVICFIVLSLLSHKVRIATGRAVRYAQREDDVPVALQRPRQRHRHVTDRGVGIADTRAVNIQWRRA